MTAQRRLIVGSAGGAPAFGVIRSVRERYGNAAFVIAIDTNPSELVAASALADAFVRVPAASDPAFCVALRDIAAVYPASGYLPLHDDEIDVATRLAAAGGFPPGLDLIAPPLPVARLCSDKWAMHQWLIARGLPSPRTMLATSAGLNAMPRPVVLKPRESCGGQNFRRIRQAAELEGLDPEEWLLQEPLERPEIGLDIFLSRDGRVFRCVCRQYLEVRASVATKVRIFEDRPLAAIVERLVREMPLHGASLVQVMRDQRGIFCIMDVNPRVGSATRMCVPCGLDFAAANIADFWGESTNAILRPLAGEYYVARQYEEYVTSGPCPAPPGSGA